MTTEANGTPRDIPAGGSVRATMNVNGEPVETVFPVYKSLLEVLREELNLTGTKHGCELGECGTCTVLVDGRAVLSCLEPAVAAVDAEIRTIEGVGEDGPHPLQEAFADLGAAQCGYCTPGIILAAKALLDSDPDPSRRAIEEALAGNLCRCTGYLKICEAVEWAARRLQGDDSPPPEWTVEGYPAGAPGLPAGTPGADCGVRPELPVDGREV